MNTQNLDASVRMITNVEIRINSDAYILDSYHKIRVICAIRS